ncbi:MAG: hypothetical protein DHS20C14_03990 [Phycisphaeraceae bacterium]|nr:MAG: hypothetical protein DHS20C14_03990 [Phycisphaeraceae bacterium]
MTTTRSIAVAVLAGAALSPSACAQFLEPDAAALYTLQRGAGFGWAVSELRDIDGDGLMEGIGSTPSGSQSRGRVVVFSGATGDILFEFDGPNPGDGLGYSVADAGDVDNDGFVDVIAGSPGRGGMGGVVVLSGNPASYGSIIWNLSGPEAGAGFGYAVSTLDDTNGDGHADFLVGASGVDGGTLNEGRVYIYDGATGMVLRELEGSNTASALLGQGVAGVGDLDGDGVIDAAASAPGEAIAYAWSGATGAKILPPMPGDASATSVYGQFFVGRCGDVSGDGTPDIYVGDYNDSKGYVYSGEDGSRWLTLEAPNTDGLGPGRGLMADINQDGHDDLTLGWYTNADGAPGAGKVVIYSGADGAVLRTLTSDIAGFALGFDCVGVGDVTGDGWVDLIASGSSKNRVYLIPGVNPCPADFTRDATLTLDDVEAFAAAFLGGETGADLDYTGTLNIDDVEAFVVGFLAGCP